MTTTAIIIASGIVAAAYLIGVGIGIWIGSSANWLRPTVQRQREQLDQAWATIERLQRSKASADDWQELGIGR
jgi:uncharacterized protein (DUF58 family)